MGVSQSVDQHPERCRGPQDSGKVIWWVFRPDQGINELVLEPVEAIVRQVGSKYVCKNHAKEQHGFWWEQSR
jgi:hypothetical protein